MGTAEFCWEVPILRAQAKVNILGLMVSLDREEKGKDTEKSALLDIRERYGFDTNAIVGMHEVREYLKGREVNGKVLIDDSISKALDEYYAQYGAKD